MTTLSESEWKQGMVEAGFTEVKVQKVGLKPGFTGTLAISGKNLHQIKINFLLF